MGMWMKMSGMASVLGDAKFTDEEWADIPAEIEQWECREFGGLEGFSFNTTAGAEWEQGVLAQTYFRMVNALIVELKSRMPSVKFRLELPRTEWLDDGKVTLTGENSRGTQANIDRMWSFCMEELDPAIFDYWGVNEVFNGAVYTVDQAKALTRAYLVRLVAEGYGQLAEQFIEGRSVFQAHAGYDDLVAGLAKKADFHVYYNDEEPSWMTSAETRVKACALPVIIAEQNLFIGGEYAPDSAANWTDYLLLSDHKHEVYGWGRQAVGHHKVWSNNPLAGLIGPGGWLQPETDELKHGRVYFLAQGEGGAYGA